MLNDTSIIRPKKPSFMQRLKTNFYPTVTKSKRWEINKSYGEQIKQKDFSIIASFCGAGTIYHDVGMQFLSPTINLAFDGPDFITFVENLDFYLSQNITEYRTDKVDYPVGRIGDEVEVRFVHYKSFKEARDKWNERKKRINHNKIFIMAQDRDGMGRRDLLERFDALPYKKIMFVARPYDYEWASYCKCFKGRDYVGVLTGISNFKGQRYYEQYMDVINTFNSL